MNCIKVREQLPGLAYNELPPKDTEWVKDHLTQCPACRAEYASLQELQSLLGGVRAPPVTVSLPAIFRQATDLQYRRARRWRRAAYSLGGIAACVLFVLFLRVEIRFGSEQVVVRWGGSSPGVESKPDPKVTLPTPISAEPANPAASEAELQPLRGLIYAMAADMDQLSREVDTRDRRQQQNFAGLQEQVTQLRVAFQRQMATYLADSSKKGENQ
jgi:anti-sigma factor RsiW